jgi:uncharacterized protein YeaO (DUF488 family)
VTGRHLVRAASAEAVPLRRHTKPRQLGRTKRCREIALKRVYDQAAAGDGLRVLVDRLWPRGITRAELSADLWLRDAAPSPQLRRWYGHDSRRWVEFCDRFREELRREPGVVRVLRGLRRRGPLTLLFAARNRVQNHAAALRDFLNERP